MGLRLLRKLKDLTSKFTRERNRDYVLSLMSKNSICAEIGVWKGDFSKRILKITQPKVLYLIDAWKSEIINDNSDTKNLTQNDFDLLYSNVLKKFSNNDNVKILRQNSREALETFPDEYFDWIYIDASHHYENVLQDLETARVKLKHGGIIAFDDYVNAAGKWDDDVIRAVNDFAKKYSLHVESINNQVIIILS